MSAFHKTRAGHVPGRWPDSVRLSLPDNGRERKEMHRENGELAPLKERGGMSCS